MSKRKKIQTTNKHTVDAKPTDNLVSVLDFTLFLLRRSKTPIKRSAKDKSWGGEN